MKKLLSKIIVTGMIMIPGTAAAGQFYEIHPPWLQIVYYLLLLVFLAGSAFLGYSIYAAMRGGKLGRPWLLMTIALAVMLVRTVFGFVAVLGLAYFKALFFAGLDVLFVVLLIIGMILHKESLQ